MAIIDIANGSSPFTTQTFTAQAGDVFNIPADMVGNIWFKGSAEFTVNITDDMTGRVTDNLNYIQFDSGTEPTVNIAAGVDTSPYKIATKGDSLTVNIGDGATVGSIDTAHPFDGPMTVTAGNDVTVAGNVANTSAGDGIFSFGDGASISGSVHGSAGGSADITFGNGASIGGNLTGAVGSQPDQNSTITIGDDFALTGSLVSNHTYGDRIVEIGDNATINNAINLTGGTSYSGSPASANLTIGDDATVLGNITGTNDDDTFVIGDNWDLANINMLLGNDNITLGMQAEAAGLTQIDGGNPNGDGNSFGSDFDGITITPRPDQIPEFQAAGYIDNGDGTWSAPPAAFNGNPVLAQDDVGTYFSTTSSVAVRDFEGPAEPIVTPPTPPADPSGIVDGENFAEVMTPGYDDANAPTDSGGDTIDGPDGIDDTILGNGGDDTIDAGLGDDLVSGGSGDDSIDGNVGNDTIYGDQSSAVIGDGERESFNWQGISDTQADGSFTQDTGNVTVTYTRTQDTGTHNSTVDDSTLLNTAGIDGGGETVDNNSSLYSETDGQGNTGEFQWAFSDPVSDVEFNVNDLDGDGLVTVRAFDAAGNEIPVTLTGGSDVNISGNVADAEGPYQNPNDPDTTVQVNIAGPVSRIELEHTQNGLGNSAINITDLYFDAGGIIDDSTVAGDDTIDGGTGDDVIYGDNGGDAPDTPSTVGTVPDEGGVATLLVWDASQLSFTGGNPFPDGTGGLSDSSVDDITMTIGSNQTPVGVGVQDGSSSHFNDGDLSQDLVNNEFIDGVSGGAGDRITPEYSYSVQNTDTGEIINVYAVEFNGNQVVGFVSDAPMEQGATYQFLDNTSTSPSVPYDDLATTYIIPGTPNGGTDDGGDDVIEGGLGADTMFGEGGDDTFVIGSAEDADGDVVVGGNGPDETTDNDVLDLTAAGDVVIDDAVDANDDGATAGTVTFENGEVLTFSGIETILFDSNGAPIAVDDDVNVNEDGSVTFDPTANDTDPEGDDVTVESFTQPDNGMVTQDPITGELTYTPDENYFGDDSFTVTVTDPEGATSTSTVNITVAPVNDAPDAVADTETMLEDGDPILIDVLDNDTDIEDDDLVITQATVPTEQGTVEIVGGQLLFTPAEDFNGPATISYAISDGNGGTDTAVVTVNVIPVNDAPEAVDDIYETSEDTPITFIPNPAANDLDVDGDDLTVTDASVPAAQGTVDVDPNTGEVTFTPTDNFNGPATITYTVEDPSGASDTGTITVNVGAVVDAPTANDDDATTDEDVAVTIDVLDNDSDPENQDLTITSATVVDPTQGEVDIVNNELVFTPAEDFNGVAEITYGIVDTEGGTDTATVTVVVDPVNDLPVAVNDIQNTLEEEPITFNPAENDTDVETPTEDLVVVDATVDPEFGEVVVNADGTITFTPADEYNGPAPITYTVEDEDGGQATGTALVNVGPVNDAPEPVNDTASTDQGEPVVINVLDNDSDPDNTIDELTVTAASVPPEQGTVTFDGTTVTFTPAAAFVGEATINYTITDPDGLSGSAQITVDVADVVGPIDGTDDGQLMEPGFTDAQGDEIDGTDGINDTIFGNGGDDTIDGGLGDDTIDGGDDDDSITGGVGDDSVLGGDGADTLAGGDGDDTLEGGDGDDDIAVNDGDTALGGIGDDVFTLDDTDPTADIDGVTIDGGSDGTQPGDAAGPENGDVGDVLDLSDQTDDLEVVFDTDPEDGTVDGLDTDSAPDVTFEEIEQVITGSGDDVIDGGNSDGPIDVETNEGDDTVTGTDDDDEIDTGDDDDVVDGGGGDDTIDGGDGDDEIDGGDGDDDIEGGDGSDTIDGGDGNDTIDAGAGDDDITAGVGDVIDGGTGDDDIVIDPTSEGPGTITIDGGDDATSGFPDDDANGDDGDTLDLTGLTNVVFTNGPTDDGTGSLSGTFTYDDPNGDPVEVTFTEIENLLLPPDGVVDGEETGEDMGPGYDDSDGPTDGGGDIIDGPDGIDDVIEGNGGDDTIDGGLGDDTIDGGDDDDSITGGVGDDSVLGGDGADTLAGGDGDDTLEGGDGDDDIAVNDGDTALGGIGDDVFTLDDTDPTADIDGVTIDGGSDGTQPGDAAGPENGDVGDVLDLSDQTNDLEVVFDDTDPEDGTVDGLDTDGAPDIAFEEIEKVITGAGDDEIDGGDSDGPIDVETGGGDDTITGTDGDDTIDSGDDDDEVTTGTGNDSVVSEGGDNEIDTSGGEPDPITGIVGTPDAGYPGLFTGDSDPADDLDTVVTGDGNDTITTGDDDDVIDAGDGDNVIDAGFDDDTVTTGDGDDTIVGGEGNDSIDAGEGNDLIYAGNDPSVPESANIPDEDLGGLSPDLVPDNGLDTVSGGAGNDTIFGADDNDLLMGDEGDDLINGGIDDDTLMGGTGDDTLIGGQGADSMEGGAGEDTFVIADPDDALYQAGSGIGDEVDGGSGGTPVSDNTGAPNEDWDVLDLRGSAPEGGSLTVTETGPDSNGNGTDGFVTYFDADGNTVGTLEFTEIEDVIPCFTPGTLIATPTGERRVENLEVGDRVITRDNGIQEIRWVGKREMAGEELARAPHFNPILIRAGALGRNVPERDMLVSPQHRMLITGDGPSLFFDESEVLVAAKHLTHMDGVDVVDVSSTTYIHVMFEQHEVILSDGAWSESFQPGDMTLSAMGDEQRAEILELFPELDTPEGIETYTSARRAIKKHEAKLLA